MPGFNIAAQPGRIAQVPSRLRRFPLDCAGSPNEWSRFHFRAEACATGMHLEAEMRRRLRQHFGTCATGVPLFSLNPPSLCVPVQKLAGYHTKTAIFVGIGPIICRVRTYPKVYVHLDHTGRPILCTYTGRKCYQGPKPEVYVHLERTPGPISCTYTGKVHLEHLLARDLGVFPLYYVLVCWTWSKGEGCTVGRKGEGSNYKARSVRTMAAMASTITGVRRAKQAS